jgi:copper chaperone NosL
MKNSTISLSSKVALLMASVLLFTSIFFPLWRIELEAPQYPEGLVLQLHADKIGGDVDIINGLNHYIGMKTLHAENFFEFSVLKYIFIGFALLGIVIIVVAKKKGVYVFFTAFVLFVVLSAVDFYRWNYDYGHDLDPNAAIKVPGMAYQPPLLGYKQLLNFGAYSIPDVGGFMLIGAGLLLFAAVVKETNFLRRFKKANINAALLVLLSISFLSCSANEPKPIKLNSDSCDFCKMTISNGKFASQLITEKGRYYKFDDISCMVKYAKSTTTVAYKGFYVTNYLNENEFLSAEKGFYLKGGTIASPMRGNIAAFDTEKNATLYQNKLAAQKQTWDEVYNAY